MFYEDASDYQSLLPEHWRELLEIQAVGGCVNVQMDKLLARIGQGVANKSPSLANEDGVARWERILGVTSPRGSGLQARREACRAKIMSKPPINLQTFRAVVEAYMGLEVEVELAPDFTVRVWYRGESRQADLTPLYATVYEMIPANLIVEIVYRWAIWGEVKTAFPTWGDLIGLTWGEVRKGT